MPKKEIHVGIVTDNNDPDKLGRLTVDCPTIVADDILDWVEPTFFYVDSENSAGCFFIPSIGSEVEVEIESEEESEIIGLEAKWRCAIYPEGTVPEEFQENYPERRGWKTAAGHVFYFDDTEGSKTFTYTHPSGSEIIVDDLGDLKLKIPAGNKIYVGDEADEQIVKGNILKTFLDDLKIWLESHMHDGGVLISQAGGGSVTGLTGVPSTAPATPDQSPIIPVDLLSDHLVK